MKQTNTLNCRALRSLLATLLLVTSVAANAYDFKVDGIYYRIRGSNVNVTYEYYEGVGYDNQYDTFPDECYSDYSGNVVIPDSVTYDGITYAVTAIGSNAFENCSGLTSVVIPESVTSIGSLAFYNCKGLTSVTIPNSVTEIGGWAFRNCSSLTDITLPDSLTTISSSLLDRCSSLTGELVIPDGVTSIGIYAFSCCTGLTSVSIPNSVTEIGDYAFDCCKGLTSVTIPNSVTTIGSYAFWDCYGLMSVTIGNSVTSIGRDAFRSCTGLTEVTIPNSVTTIDEWAFYDCTGLTEVTIPNSVTTIGSSAFWGCKGLTDVNFNAIACTSAGSSSSPVFGGCANLSTVTIGEEVTILPDYLFYNCTGITEVNFNAINCTSVSSSTFSGCTNISTVTIGETVTVIPDYLFYNCTGLTEIYFNAIACTSVGSSAFDNCKNISGASVGDNVTLIPSNIFSDCSCLTSLTIPESVDSIGDGAFSGCTGLTEVILNAISCESAGSSESPVFEGCTSLSTVTIDESVNTIPAYLLYGCSELTEVTIPESVTRIGDGAFAGCSGLTTTIPNGVVTIGGSAFENCVGLTELSIPESVTYIGDSAFSGCSGICSISNVGKTQTTCEMCIDGNISGAESGIVFEDGFYTMDADTSYLFEDLKPGYEHAFYYGIKLWNGSLSRHECLMVMTVGVDPTVTLTGMTPDTFSAIGSYVEEDAVVTETGFTGYETDGETISLQDLEPNTQYTVEYYVVASDVKYTTEYNFTTPDVEFTTFPTKEASNTVVLLCAATNLSDNAIGAGYEWRRSDAPDLIPSTQAECPIIDGELTGALVGLTPNSYYLFRPYYTSLGGVTYYGDWAAFITAAEYVYFAPTVRTYEATSVGSESATVKAYAVAGSDEIISQGFEYWEGGSSSAMNVRRASATDDNGVTRVEVSGQRMTATLENLEPSTTYSYRAYVTTAVGTTYGETMSFTTDVPTSIESTTLTEDAEVYEIARYTLDGKKVSQPQRGINIIRYSDGTAKKVLVK